MKTIYIKLLYGVLFACICTLISCSDFEIPDHRLDIEYKYELTCSESLLKYVKPQVTITDTKGVQTVITIEDNMWTGSNHKTWSQIVHYDSLNVSSTMMVKYIPKSGNVYQDEPSFDSFHHLDCIISIQEDGDGRRNNYTIVPDFTSTTSVNSTKLEEFIIKLGERELTRGGSVDNKGEITKIEIEK